MPSALRAALPVVIPGRRGRRQALGLSRRHAETLEAGLVRRGASLGIALLGGERYWADVPDVDLQRMAGGGNADAQASLAWRLANPLRGSTRPEAALRWALRSADAGSAAGYAVLGWLLLRGIGSPPDEAEALQLYAEAAARGSALASYELGECLAQGIGLGQPDPVAAHARWRAAAAAGHPRAHLRLAHASRLGEGTPRDLAAAADWYRRAAALGVTEAWVWLGEFLEHGLGGKADPAGARRAYAEAARLGDAHGRGEFGRCLLHGIGGTADARRGRAELEAALVQGWQPAREELAQYCYQSALACLQRATRAGDACLADAVGLLRQAAENGHVRAAWTLGQCLVHGTGIERDEVQGLKWFRRAGQLVDAQLAVADMLYFGRGVAPDAAEAYAWYLRAALEHQDAHAMYSCGFCLLHGSGTARDVSGGLRWLERAARQGEANAAWELALHFLESGRGQARRGLRWLRLAAHLGHAAAAAARAGLAGDA